MDLSYPGYQSGNNDEDDEENNDRKAQGDREQRFQTVLGAGRPLGNGNSQTASADWFLTGFNIKPCTPQNVHPVN